MYTWYALVRATATIESCKSGCPINGKTTALYRLACGRTAVTTKELLFDQLASYPSCFFNVEHDQNRGTCATKFFLHRGIAQRVPRQVFSPFSRRRIRKCLTRFQPRLACAMQMSSFAQAQRDSGKLCQTSLRYQTFLVSWNFDSTIR